MSTDQGLPPASGAWREGDPVAFRRFAHVGAVDLEFGASLASVTVAYETWGTLADDGNNAVLIEHALTGDSHASGSTAPGQPTPGWWDALIGPGKVIDTDRWFVVCTNVLGGCQGTTGPASTAPDGRPYGSRWPRITTRDQVLVESRLADQLGIDRFAAVIGGSMGGMRALEWLIMFPDRIRSAALLATVGRSHGRSDRNSDRPDPGDRRRRAMARRRLLRGRRWRRSSPGTRHCPSLRAPDLPHLQRAGPAVRSRSPARR